MPADDQVERAADAFRLLSDPTRMKIIWALLQGETSVACLAELIGAAPTAVSQHLSKLRLAGIVRGRRQGTFVYYTAADDHIRRLLDRGPLPRRAQGRSRQAEVAAAADPWPAVPPTTDRTSRVSSTRSSAATCMSTPTPRAARRATSPRTNGSRCASLWRSTRSGRRSRSACKAPPRCCRTTTLRSSDSSPTASLAAVTSHGELERPGTCFVKISPGRRLATFGIGVSEEERAADPLSVTGSVEW